MSTLRMNGQRVSSLAELRQHFDFANAKDYLYQGRLSVWMREIGENELADELDDIKKYDNRDELLWSNFIGIFSLPKKQIPAKVSEQTKKQIPAKVSEQLEKYSKEVESVRKKLEGKDEPGKFTVSRRDPKLLLSLLSLLYDYFDKWSEALRKAKGKALSGTRFGLTLKGLDAYTPFRRCIELIDRSTRRKRTGDVFSMYMLPDRVSWTTRTRPEQVEKAKMIAAYSVCFVEFEYRLGVSGKIVFTEKKTKNK